MRNDAQKVHQGGVPRAAKGNGFFSMRTLSGYLRIVSSGASTVASTVRSAGVSVASSLAENDAAHDQVHWSGFDKVEFGDDVVREVLLLAYRSGFEVWDVEEADDVRQLASRRDGPVSFLQLQKKPLASKASEDKFADVRPLLVIAGDGSSSGAVNNYDMSVGGCQEQGNGNFVSTNVQFYSLRTHVYVHSLKFRSAVYSIRCSPRVVAVSQASQIHCFDAATLKREYTILTNPIVWGLPGSGVIGCGPLAVGPRWLAYSGSPVSVSNAGRVSPQHLNSSSSFSSSPSNGSLVAHYAKESSKQLASGIVTLGDMGYKKLFKYCSEHLPDGNTSVRQVNHNLKSNVTINGHRLDTENAGMVIVRDLVSKSVVVQFRAHASPISALCFDPSGTLLVTASIHGHNINIFRVMSSCCGSSSGSDANGSYIHLYRLQRGFTNAVIQDISFSSDSQYIMISSSRGTSHLFALSPSGESPNIHPYDVTFTNSNNGLPLIANMPVRWPSGSGPSMVNQHSFFRPSTPVTLSVISRIRNGSNGWKGAVSGAAAAATGRVSPLSGAVASAFHKCKAAGVYPGIDSLMTKYYLLVFSPSGCIIQYVLRHSTAEDSGNDMLALHSGSHDLSQDTDTRLVVEAVQKWDVCHKRTRRDHGDNIDIYGQNGSGDDTKFLSKGSKKGTNVYPTDGKKEHISKLSTEEKHHMYISEFELHVHPPRVPLWAKPEIYFQAFMDDSTAIQSCNLLGGEMEIERIPTRTIEARSKDLIPAFDYLQMPRLQNSRSSTAESNRNGLLLHQRSGLSEDEKLPQRSRCSSVDCMSESAASTELPDGIVESGWGSHQASSEALMDFVNTRDSQNVNDPPLEFVNKINDPKRESHFEHVNNVENPKMESRFLDGDNDID